MKIYDKNIVINLGASEYLTIEIRIVRNIFNIKLTAKPRHLYLKNRFFSFGRYGIHTTGLTKHKKKFLAPDKVMIRLTFHQIVNKSKK